jgi:RNA polymerase sigma factor (sigma-70 family)
MSTALGAVLRHLCKLARTPATEAVADRHLLERFATQKDEDSFAELVRRHGPLVLAVCRRVLLHEHDAEDAFQAAFLVLARRAASIRKGESVGSFLYGVAYRIAMKERTRLARRRQRERHVQPPAATGADYEAAWRELQGLLDEGLHRLPEKYRTPFVLCCLEGKSKKEAACELGCKEGTVSSRLARARKELVALLSRKGVSLAVALAAVDLTQSAASEAVPPPLADACVQAAMHFCAGTSLGAGAGRAARLAEAALGSMTALRWKVATTLLLTACLTLGGAGPEPPAAAVRKGDTPSLATRSQPEAKGKAPRDRYGDPLPEGAVARLGTVRFRFPSAGTAFLPDGKTVVSAGPDSIKLWEARTGRLLREFDTGTFTSSAGGGGGIAVSADGKRLAVSGQVHGDSKPGWRPAAAVFDLGSRKPIRVIERHPLEGVHGLTMSPDGKLLFTLDRNGKLRVEEVATGVELLVQQFPGDVIAHLAISADGSMLAIASGPNTHKIFVWRWQAAEGPREVASGWHRGRVVAFSPDGKLLAECSDAEPDVRLIEVASGRLLCRLELPDHQPYQHYEVAFAPNGRLLAAYGGSNDRSAVHFWDPRTGAFVKRLPFSRGGLAFSPDSTLLVAGSQVWDFTAGKDLSANDETHRGAVNRLLTGPQGLVITAGDDNTIRLWDAATGRQRLHMAQDSRIAISIGAMALSPDGTRLVSSSMRDDQVYLWDMSTGKWIYRLPGHGSLGSVAAAAVFLPDGKSFRTWGAADMCLRQWDVRTGKALSEHVIRPAGIPVPSEDDEPFERDQRLIAFSGAHFTSDARSLIFQANRKWHVFDAATGKLVRSFPSGEDMVIGTAVSPDGKLVLASAYGRSIEIKLPGGGMQSTTPKDHPLILWRLDTGKVHKRITLPEETPGPVAFSPDGKLFATASSGPGTHICLFQATNGRVVHKIEGFRGTVRSLVFLPDGPRLISGMDDGSALVWDLERARPLAPVEKKR